MPFWLSRIDSCTARYYTPLQYSENEEKLITMPMYQFACRECGHDFEKKLRMSQSDEVQACPACGGRETRRRFGSVASVRSGSRAAVRSAPPPSSPFT